MKNTGKVVVLGGTPRAGKSTISNELVKNGFNKISFDYLNSALQNGLNINLNADELYPFFENIVKTALEDAKIYGLNTVIDMYDFLPKHISKLPFKDEIEVYFLAYPDDTIEDIKFNVINYASKTDWIYQVDEEYLNMKVKDFHIRNQLLVKECEKYDCKLVNVLSKDNRMKVLNKLLETILTKSIYKK